MRIAPELIIFDCDGVLVDTERVANALLSEALASLGIEIDFTETVTRFKGRSGTDCLAIIERDFGVRMPAALLDECRGAIIERFEAEPRSMPGVEAALDAIATPTCVASSGEHHKMRRTLGATGLLARFEGRIFSASEVTRGKPFPDLFLHAAGRLGANAAGCVVIEDSVPGVEAAVAAGMAVLGYVDLTPAPALEAAGARCFDDMASLPALLAEL
jgi:HAD superfamily hydrolase (TIGR01509 family)